MSYGRNMSPIPAIFLHNPFMSYSSASQLCHFPFLWSIPLPVHFMKCHVVLLWRWGGNTTALFATCVALSNTCSDPSPTDFDRKQFGVTNHCVSFRQWFHGLKSQQQNLYFPQLLGKTYFGNWKVNSVVQELLLIQHPDSWSPHILVQSKNSLVLVMATTSILPILPCMELHLKAMWELVIISALNFRYFPFVKSEW